MENVGPLLNQKSVLVAEDAEKAELLNAFFSSAFTDETGLQNSQTSEAREVSWEKENSLGCRGSG